MARTVEVEWSGGLVTGRLSGSGPRGILLAHGAGTDQDHPFMVLLREGLARRGHRVLTFNYPYTERGSKRPDPQPRLLECHRRAADLLAAEVDELYLAGRSMGGRIATHLVAEGYRADGLVLYSYPLHPAGKPDKLRTGHLREVEVPMLFFQGTRDALARADLFERHVAHLSLVRVEWLEGATHSPGGGAWTPETMAERLGTVTADWIAAVSSGRSRRDRP